MSTPVVAANGSGPSLGATPGASVCADGEESLVGVSVGVSSLAVRGGWSRGLLVAGLPAVVGVALVVTFMLVTGWPGWRGCGVVAVVLVGWVVLGVVAPRGKARVSRVVQGWLINPVMGLLVRVGVNPLGLVVLETTGRRSGRRRTVLVSGRVVDGVLWVVAEHGARAGYVRNVRSDPRVRVCLRQGVGAGWVSGLARVEEGDDVLRRLWRIAGWNPLRVYSAVLVGLFGSDLATVRIDLHG